MSQITIGQIRPLKAEDLELVLNWRNSPRIRTSMYNDQIISMENHLAWFARTQLNSFPTVFIYELNNEPRGVLNFTNLDQKNSRCDWGFYLGADDLPRGSGTSMCRLGLQYAFSDLQVRKVCGEAFAFNTASIRVHEKLGFIQEGYFREHILKNGVYKDIVRFGLLKDEFLKGESGHA